VDRTGYIISSVQWDYDTLTSAVAHPIDARPLKITGGVFTTIANRAETKITYYHRNILITRSNVIVDGVTHYNIGELEHGGPYSGFFNIKNAAYVKFTDCHFTGRKFFGAAGSYDVVINNSSDISFIDCKQNDIMDDTLWGLVGSNFCKNLYFDGCTFSRVDAHMGVSGYTIKNCVMGYMGINAIGHGLLRVENTTVLCKYNVIGLRGDYGCVWDGDVIIKNCTWRPSGAWQKDSFAVIRAGNHGGHDFGYTCRMPKNVTIDGLYVEDMNIDAGDYDGINIFNAVSNSGITDYSKSGPAANEYPYLSTETLAIKNCVTQSGKGFKIWPAFPRTCYCEKTHTMDGDETVYNFKASADGVDRLTFANSDCTGDYGDNHRLLPYAEVKNCGELVVEDGAFYKNLKND